MCRVCASASATAPRARERPRGGGSRQTRAAPSPRCGVRAGSGCRPVVGRSAGTARASSPRSRSRAAGASACERWRRWRAFGRARQRGPAPRTGPDKTTKNSAKPPPRARRPPDTTHSGRGYALETCKIGSPRIAHTVQHYLYVRLEVAAAFFRAEPHTNESGGSQHATRFSETSLDYF